MRGPAWRRMALIFGAWTVAGFFFASQLYLLYPVTSGRAMSFATSLLVNLPFYWLWALLTPAILALARRFPMDRTGWKRALAVHVPASLLLSSVQLVAAGIVFQLLLDRPGFRSFTLLSSIVALFRLNFHANFLTYWGLVCLAWGVLTWEKFRERELMASRLETQLAQAELRALKMQLQPHFLFNTLHAISALMQRNTPAAEKMVLQLADFLRLTLQNTGKQEVSLREEFEFLETYLQIEKTRFQDRLSIHFRIRSEVLDARVPNLILQPLVENAIRHGIARDRNAGRIEVSATHEAGMLLLRVWDDGPGLQPGTVTEGIGFSNTRERLRHLYGAGFRMEFANAETGGFFVFLAFPFRVAEADDGIPAPAPPEPVPAGSLTFVRGL